MEETVSFFKKSAKNRLNDQTDSCQFFFEELLLFPIRQKCINALQLHVNSQGAWRPGSPVF